MSAELRLTSGIYELVVDGALVIRRPHADAFSPADISNLHAWLKADAITGTADGAALATWEDSGSGNRDGLQATAANQPTYVASSINSKPAVQGAANKYMAIQSALPTSNTLFLVFKTTTQAAANPIFSTGSTASGVVGSPYLLLQDDNGTLRGYSEGSNGNAFWNLQAISANTPYVLTVSYNQATARINAWVNGVQRATNLTLSQVGNVASGNAYVYLLSGFNGQYRGVIAEAIIYSAVLADADRANVENHLMTKYGV